MTSAPDMACLSGRVRASPLHDFWAARSLGNNWISRGTLTLPLVLRESLEEASSFGTTAAFADISDRVFWSFDGPDALTFVAALCGETERTYRVGATRRNVWCDPFGFARGAGYVGVRDPQSLVMTTTVSDRAWFSKAAEPFDVSISSPSMVGLRVAGPHVHDYLRECDFRAAGPCMIEAPGLATITAMSPTDDAVDLWCDPDSAMGLAWLLERGGVKPAGAAALNAWRLSKGLLMSGDDWTPSQWATERTQLRQKQDLTAGGYLHAGWDLSPLADVPGAAFWPATGQFYAVLWLPAGRSAPSAPGGGVILGPAATD